MACNESLVRGVKYYRAESLGEGAYGSVQTVYDDDGLMFALKKFGEEIEDIEDEEVDGKEEEDDEYYYSDDDCYEEWVEDEETEQPGVDLGTLREISALRAVSKIKETDVCEGHPNIMRLHDVCLMDRSMAMVMPKMSCSLEKAIEAKFLSPKQKLNIAHKLVSAVAFLHANSLIHRDIKTDNVLLDDEMNPILADFSLCKVFDTELQDKTHTPSVGTCSYIAPEVVDQLGYGLACDCWSLGVVLLELFNGSLGAEKDRIALKKISDMRAKMTDKPLPQLLKAFLNPNPKQRITCEEALKLPVFAKNPTLSYSKTVSCTTSLSQAQQENKGGSINEKKKAKSKKQKKSDLGELEKLYSSFGFTNPMTLFAAEQYALRSNESAESCLILASKIYEETLINLWELKRNRDKPFSISQYVKAEKRIFMRMDFCLFV